MGRVMLEGIAPIDNWHEARERLFAEHARIVDRIDARDPEGAASEVREHVRRFYERIIDSVSYRGQLPKSASPIRSRR